jgi:hypothetical protein
MVNEKEAVGCGRSRNGSTWCVFWTWFRPPYLPSKCTTTHFPLLLLLLLTHDYIIERTYIYLLWYSSSLRRPLFTASRQGVGCVCVVESKIFPQPLSCISIGVESIVRSNFAYNIPRAGVFIYAFTLCPRYDSLKRLEFIDSAVFGDCSDNSISLLLHHFN